MVVTIKFNKLKESVNMYDNNEKEDKKKSCKKEEWAVTWFLQFTSIGGLAQHYATDWKISKVIWLLLFLAGLVLTLINVKSVLDDFQAHNVSSISF